MNILTEQLLEQTKREYMRLRTDFFIEWDGDAFVVVSYDGHDYQTSSIRHPLKQGAEDELAQSFLSSGRPCNCEDYPCCGH